jgi:hypothetical protein
MWVYGLKLKVVGYNLERDVVRYSDFVGMLHLLKNEAEVPTFSSRSTPGPKQLVGALYESSSISRLELSSAWINRVPESSTGLRFLPLALTW